MNTRLKFLFLIVVPIVAATSLLGGSGNRAELVVRNTRLASRSFSESGKLHYLGVQSCAASNCHGGMIDPNKGQNEFKGAEYTRWIENDRHAFAMSRLYNEKSQQIHRQLIKSPSYKNLLPPHQAPLCLNCHSSPSTSEGNLATIYQTKTEGSKIQRLNSTIFRDGIGCEACHGPAEKWLQPHKRPDWLLTDEQNRNRKTVLADRNKKSELGFRNTKDVFVRARICVRCHVGAPGREVNHDLIAAGHPRLEFEYSEYMARMPNHWNRSNEQDPEFLVWLSGQLTSMNASLELLEHRAQQAIDHRKKNFVIWPEFAESDCASCHHDLKASGWRPDSNSPGKALGQMRWGSSSSTMLPLMADIEMHSKMNGLLKSFVALQNIMQRPIPPADQVVNFAQSLREKHLSQLEVNLKKISDDPAVALKLLKNICDVEGPRLIERGGDSASQVYFAIKALVKHVRQSKKLHSQYIPDSDRVDKAMDELLLLLKLKYPMQFNKIKQRKKPGEATRTEYRGLNAEGRDAKIETLLNHISSEYSKPD